MTPMPIPSDYSPFAIATIFALIVICGGGLMAAIVIACRSDEKGDDE
jgi:hypothetical protein